MSDGKYIKAGKNDETFRSKGERKAALKGEIPGAAVAGSGLALMGGTALHAHKNRDELYRPPGHTLDGKGPEPGKLWAANKSLNEGKKVKGIKQLLKTKHGKVYATGVAAATAGGIGVAYGANRSANKWRKEQGLPKRDSFTNRPKKVSKSYLGKRYDQSMTTSAFGIDHGDISKGIGNSIANTGRRLKGGYKFGRGRQSADDLNNLRTSTGMKTSLGSDAAFKAGRHIGSNRGAYATGAAVTGGAATAGGGAYAYKKRKNR